MFIQLGLSDSILSVSHSHTRLIIFTNQHGLVELPSGLSWLLQAKKPFSQPLLYSIVRELFNKGRGANDADESIHDFINRSLGTEV